jgi:transposase
MIGRKGVEQLLDVVGDANDKRLPEMARLCVAALGAQTRCAKRRRRADANRRKWA